MDTDWPGILSDWLRFITAGAVGGGLSLWAALGRRDRAIAAELQALANRLDGEQEVQNCLLAKLEHGRASGEECRARGARLVACEQALRLGVSQEDLKRAHVRMDRFEGNLGHITGLLEGLSHGVERIEKHLLAHGPRAGERL